ncbi:uncharacterized protein F5891DRAFT_985838 [Suillus fuscotomentosus]|uniref:Uncharacterized protein n=1 Tax=Suillus fuscotomentosus TaxID=1912939 RepID=A0AAD4HEC7_9AGAM|nr:uncharacterized protein F5891DRAFT_985838 [Suillus fuscotomentosus]KAG1893488.1 hypothetical protein F5891DRAFT_985838 [Suillus fuscotomentosus]
MYSEPDKKNYEPRVPLPAQQSPPPSWNKTGSWQAIDVVPILADDENPSKQHSTEHSGCRTLLLVSQKIHVHTSHHAAELPSSSGLSSVDQSRPRTPHSRKTRLSGRSWDSLRLVFDFNMVLNPKSHDLSTHEVVHMRWTASMEKFVDGLARRTMNVLVTKLTPPYYIDPHTAWVSEVQKELHTRKGIDATHVIMTSGERNPEWWSDVRALGRTRVDYAAERTEEIYGQWHPAFLDAIIQSNGAGFVSTRGSTISTLASRRVQPWHDRATRLVRWGWPSADDH